jgi:hypothetical protein
VSSQVGNYGAGLQALLKAKGQGFNDVVYLDARTDSELEELSAANIFVLKVRRHMECAHIRDVNAQSAVLSMLLA